MSALRDQVLNEVAELDIKDLQLLQPILAALKKKTQSTNSQQLGVAAAHCRKTLADMKWDFSQAIIDDREDRL